MPLLQEAARIACRGMGGVWPVLLLALVVLPAMGGSGVVQGDPLRLLAAGSLTEAIGESMQNRGGMVSLW